MISKENLEEKSHLNESYLLELWKKTGFQPKLNFEVKVQIWEDYFPHMFLEQDDRNRSANHFWSNKLNDFPYWCFLQKHEVRNLVKLHVSIYGSKDKIMQLNLTNGVLEAILTEIKMRNVLSRDKVVDLIEGCKRFVGCPSNVSLSDFYSPSKWEKLLNVVEMIITFSSKKFIMIRNKKNINHTKNFVRKHKLYYYRVGNKRIYFPNEDK